MESSQNPTVSVVVTCYNQASYLGEAIGSVLSQTYRDFEVFVVDDGSTDNTSVIAGSYAGLQYVRRENGGVAAARNFGLGLAAGDYIVFLDGDDRLLPDALMIGVDNLSERPECAFTFGFCKHISADGSPIPSGKQNCEDLDNYEALLRGNCLWMPAMVMYRRTALESVGGFDTAADHACDFDLYLRLTRDFPVSCHGEYVAEWRQHDSNTSNKSDHMLRCALTAYRAQKPFVQKEKRLKEAYKYGIKAKKYYYGEEIAHSVRTSVRNSEWMRATRGILTLLRYYPQGVTTHIYRKLYCSIFRIKSDGG
jgi:glycosyltransferase involved in cell wall biosynthesis